MTSNDDEQRIGSLGNIFEDLDQVNGGDHFPTKSPTEVQQPMTAFTPAVADIEPRGSKDRRPTQGEDRRRRDDRQPSDERRGRNRLRNDPPERDDERPRRRNGKDNGNDGGDDDEDPTDDRDDHDRRGRDRQERRGRKPKRGPLDDDDDGDDGSGGGRSSEDNGRCNCNPQDDAPEDSDASCAPATRFKYEFGELY
jgi:hypothetical protein